MDDATYTFIQHQRETKSIAHSARLQRKGIKPRKVIMSSDYLTSKEKKELNGKVMTYDLNKPHKHHELFFWPEDLQREYVQRIIDIWNPPLQSLRKDVLHVSWETMDKYLNELGVVTTMKHQTGAQKVGYNCFLKGELRELKKEAKEETPEFEKPEPKPEPKPKAESSLVMAYPEYMNVRMEGLPMPIMETVAKFMLDPKSEYLIHITAERKRKEKPNEQCEEDPE